MANVMEENLDGLSVVWILMYQHSKVLIFTSDLKFWIGENEY